MQEIIELKGTRWECLTHIIVAPKDEREWTETVSDEIIADYLNKNNWRTILIRSSTGSRWTLKV